MDRKAISFWIWAAFNIDEKGFFYDLESLFQQLVERGFQCIRLDDAAGFTHDSAGRRRGEIEILSPFPGYHAQIRQNERCFSGVCDPLKNLLRIGSLAKKYNIKLILSSWYYLHTEWYANAEIEAELSFGLAPEKRYDYFARALHYILREFEDAGLQDVIEFVEIFNEADGLPFVTDFGSIKLSETELNAWRTRHEEAIHFLQSEHPGIKVAYDTFTPYTNELLFPRNAQVWDFHSYYMWGVYNSFDKGMIGGKTDPDDPSWNFIREYMIPDAPPYRDVVNSRAGRVQAVYGWYRRVWLYNHLNPARIPEIDQILRNELAQNIDLYKRNVEDAVAHVLDVRQRIVPGVPLYMGEGATYCSSSLLRWEEQSPEYWDVISHAARVLRDAGIAGTVPRTNSGPEDPAWCEVPEKLLRVNREFTS